MSSGMGDQEDAWEFLQAVDASAATHHSEEAVACGLTTALSGCRQSPSTDMCGAVAMVGSCMQEGAMDDDDYEHEMIEYDDNDYTSYVIFK